MPHTPAYADARALHRAKTVVFTPRKDCSEVASSDSRQLERAAELKIKFSSFVKLPGAINPFGCGKKARFCCAFASGARERARAERRAGRRDG
jgi:hypothetical protein